MLSEAKVRFRHFRFSPSGELAQYMRGVKGQFIPAARGGKTVCIISVNGQEFTAEAICSENDSFSYELGRRISYGRARKQAEQAGIDLPPKVAKWMLAHP